MPLLSRQPDGSITQSLACRQLKPRQVSSWRLELQLDLAAALLGQIIERHLRHQLRLGSIRADWCPAERLAEDNARPLKLMGAGHCWRAGKPSRATLAAPWPGRSTCARRWPAGCSNKLDRPRFVRHGSLAGSTMIDVTKVSICPPRATHI